MLVRYYKAGSDITEVGVPSAEWQLQPPRFLGEQVTLPRLFFFSWPILAPRAVRSGSVVGIKSEGDIMLLGATTLPTVAATGRVGWGRRERGWGGAGVLLD